MRCSSSTPPRDGVHGSHAVISEKDSNSDLLATTPGAPK